MRAPLPDLLITVNDIQLEKVCVWKILGPFVNTLTADDKYCLLNRYNLLPHFHMQLSHKQKKIFSVFLHF